MLLNEEIYSNYGALLTNFMDRTVFSSVYIEQVIPSIIVNVNAIFIEFRENMIRAIFTKGYSAFSEITLRIGRV